MSAVASHGGSRRFWQQPRRNAFALLAEGAKKEASVSCLPEKKGIVGNAAVRGDWRLHNDLCDELKAAGKRVLNTLTDVRPQKLAPGQLLALQQALDDNMYICGAPLFPPEHAGAVQQGQGAGGC